MRTSEGREEGVGKREWEEGRKGGRGSERKGGKRGKRE